MMFSLNSELNDMRAKHLVEQVLSTKLELVAEHPPLSNLSTFQNNYQVFYKLSDDTCKTLYAHFKALHALNLTSDMCLYHQDYSPGHMYPKRLEVKTGHFNDISINTTSLQADEVKAIQKAHPNDHALNLVGSVHQLLEPILSGLAYTLKNFRISYEPVEKGGKIASNYLHTDSVTQLRFFGVIPEAPNDEKNAFKCLDKSATLRSIGDGSLEISVDQYGTYELNVSDTEHARTNIEQRLKALPNGTLIAFKGSYPIYYNVAAQKALQNILPTLHRASLPHETQAGYRLSMVVDVNFNI